MKKMYLFAFIVCMAFVCSSCAVTGVAVGTYKVATDPRSPKEVLADKRIELEVHKVLWQDETVKDYDLDVVSIQGHVYLAGQTHSERERVRAANLARIVDGVKEVTTDAVKVRHKFREGPDDLEICNLIRFEFIKDLCLRWLNLGVHCNEGDVTLTGIVKTGDERQRAERHAKDTEGVRSVTNHIVIKSSP